MCVVDNNAIFRILLKIIIDSKQESLIAIFITISIKY